MHQRLPPDDVIEPDDRGPGLPPGWTPDTIGECDTGRLRVINRPRDGAANLYWSPPPSDGGAGIMSGLGLIEIMDTMRAYRNVLAGRKVTASYPLMPDQKFGLFMCILAPGNYTIRNSRFLDWHPEPEPATPGVPALEPEVARKVAYRNAFGDRRQPQALPVDGTEALTPRAARYRAMAAYEPDPAKAKAAAARVYCSLEGARASEYVARYRAARPDATEAEVAGAVYEFVRGAPPSAFRPRLNATS